MLATHNVQDLAEWEGLAGLKGAASSILVIVRKGREYPDSQ